MVRQTCGYCQKPSLTGLPAACKRFSSVQHKENRSVSHQAGLNLKPSERTILAELQLSRASTRYFCLQEPAAVRPKLSCKLGLRFRSLAGAAEEWSGRTTIYCSSFHFLFHYPFVTPDPQIIQNKLFSSTCADSKWEEVPSFDCRLYTVVSATFASVDTSSVCSCDVGVSALAASTCRKPSRDNRTQPLNPGPEP